MDILNKGYWISHHCEYLLYLIYAFFFVSSSLYLLSDTLIPFLPLDRACPSLPEVIVCPNYLWLRLIPPKPLWSYESVITYSIFTSVSGRLSFINDLIKHHVCSPLCLFCPFGYPSGPMGRAEGECVCLSEVCSVLRELCEWWAEINSSEILPDGRGGLWIQIAHSPPLLYLWCFWQCLRYKGNGKVTAVFDACLFVRFIQQ